MKKINEMKDAAGNLIEFFIDDNGMPIIEREMNSTLYGSTGICELEQHAREYWRGTKRYKVYMKNLKRLKDKVGFTDEIFEINKISEIISKRSDFIDEAFHSIEKKHLKKNTEWINLSMELSNDAFKYYRSCPRPCPDTFDKRCNKCVVEYTLLETDKFNVEEAWYDLIGLEVSGEENKLLIPVPVLYDLLGIGDFQRIIDLIPNNNFDSRK